MYFRVFGFSFPGPSALRSVDNINIEKYVIVENGIKRALKDIFLPSYDECSIFLMNFTFLLLFIFNSSCRTEILSFYSPSASADYRGALFAIIVTLMFLGGLSASIFHIFAKGEKEEIAETLMKFSAMLVNGVAGIACGIYLFENGINLIIISPLWNIVMGTILLYQIGFIEAVSFDQKDTSFQQAIFGVLSCVILFVILNTLCELYWAISFSVIVNYVIGINHFLSKGHSYLKKHVILIPK